MTRPLYLHIGLQKTGTSYLQGLFLGNVDALRGAGLEIRSAVLSGGGSRSAHWPQIFADDERMTGALLDRLTHRVHILEANGESYRLKEAKKRRKTSTKRERD